jgi:hypothetical protein
MVRTVRATDPGDQSAPGVIPGRSTRGALRLLGAGGMAFVASVVGLAEAANRPRPQQLPLARLCRHGVLRACNFTCPSGWHRQVWYCQYGNRLIGCGECTHTTSGCGAGTRFYCPVSWGDGNC